MTPTEIESIFAKYHKPNWGSVSVDETLFIRDLIDRHKPKSFVEFGMASGLSCALIAKAMDDAGIDGVIHTIDHDDTFFGDKTKPNGFLIEEIYTGSRVKVHKHKFKRSIDLDDLDLGPFEMAFIDAAHPHPWPLIDTLFVRPHMTGSKTVIHHDLELFTKQRVVLGIGPKYVWDQFPESARQRGEGGASNIFSVSLDIDDATFERIFCDGILLPWTSQLGPMVVHRVRKVVERTLSKRALDAFNEAMIRFNAPKK